MKKLILTLLAMTLTTSVFAMASKPPLPSRTEAMNEECSEYGNPYGSGWNPRCQVDPMAPMIHNIDGSDKEFNCMKDAVGNVKQNPLYDVRKPTYDPSGFRACRDAYFASHPV